MSTKRPLVVLLAVFCCLLTTGTAFSPVSLTYRQPWQWPTFLSPSFLKWIFQGSDKNYIKTLKSQSLALERQLRQNQDEIAQLRSHIKVLKKSNVKLKAGARDREAEASRQAELKSLQQKIANLEREIVKVEGIKADLEKMLITEQEKVELLEGRLEESGADVEKLKEKYEREIATLREKFESQTAKKLDDLKVLMEKRMEDAIQMEREAALDRQKIAVEEAEERVQRDAEKKLKETQTRSEEAVEKEKARMRKLVRALAEREKKLLSQHELERQTLGRGLKADTSAKIHNRKAETVRGKIDP